MDWSAPIDIYCERTDPGFWSEPVNAVTNLAFLLAALWGWLKLRERDKGRPAAGTDWTIIVLIALTAAIGVGSFLFHTLATAWSGLADVLPIWIFVTAYTVVIIARLTGRHPAMITAIILGLFVLIAGAGRLLSAGPGSPSGGSDPLNGTGQYAPAVVALFVFAAILAWKRHPITPLVAGAAAVFAASLTFRTVDPLVCPALPLGTHFLWHILNGVMIALLLQAVVRVKRPRRRNRAKSKIARQNI